MSIAYDVFFFFKQKTAYEVRISDWSSDVCSSDLPRQRQARHVARMLSAQIDYQQAAAEVASLALARPPQSDTAYLKQAAMSASGLTEDKIERAASRERVCKYV